MSPIFSFRCTVKGEQHPRHVLVLFFATRLVESDALATVIDEEIDRSLVPDEVLMIVRDPGFDESYRLLTEAPTNEATFGRLGDRATVALIGYDRRGAQSRREHITGPATPFPIDFSDIRRQAMTGIFRARRGFVESTSTYHFENPSGRHTERFIRLSNILVRGAEIAFFGFCTLPFVPEGATIAYIDTPALYAVIAAINEQLSSFPGEDRQILADNFSSYGGLKEYRFDRHGDAFVLISASSSGSLGKRLASDCGFERERVVHLLFLGNGDSSIRAVCDLAFEEDLNPAGIEARPLVEQPDTCRMCEAGSVAIKLQGDQFDIAGPQPGSLLIKKMDAPATLADVIGRTAGKEIYSVGLERVRGRRPALFHINETALLASQGFTERLEYMLRRSLPASLSHVIPIDGRSEPLAESVSSFAAQMGRTVATIPASSLNAITADTQTAIMIVASVIESGRSLLDVSRDLRSVAPRAPLFYLVGLSKTTGEEHRDSLSKTLTQTSLPLMHQYVEVEKMVLPPSSAGNPWLLELKLLQDPDVLERASPEVRSYLRQRTARLKTLTHPLTDELFIENSPGQKLCLQPGFVFWPAKTCKAVHSQADVFFTIASVLQQLRANAERAGKSAIKTNWFQQTVLASANFGRFNDDIIQASILRAAYPYELNYTNSPHDSYEVGRLIRRIVGSSTAARGGAASEFLIAIATGRLRLCAPDLSDILEIQSGGTSVTDFLLELCGRQLSNGATLTAL